MDKSWKSFIDLIAMLQAGLLCWHRYAPINVKPQGGEGGGGADPGEFDILMEPESNSPPPGTY